MADINFVLYVGYQTLQQIFTVNVNLYESGKTVLFFSYFRILLHNDDDNDNNNNDNNNNGNL